VRVISFEGGGGEKDETMKQEILFKEPKTVTGTTYEAWGPVRGACGHSHRSAAAAERCAERDRKRVGALPGSTYSDRKCWRLVDGVRDARVMMVGEGEE
jgi:hypothetical protein